MKKIILVIALLVPIGVFVFLRIFGRNEFSIPVYYTAGVESPPVGCNNTYLSPYLVSDSVLRSIGWKGGVALIVADSSRATLLGLKHLQEEFKNEIQSILPPGEAGDLKELYQCQLLLQEPWRVVLIDEQRSIRGYYDPQTREEVDRMMVELKILLKQY